MSEEGQLLATIIKTQADIALEKDPTLRYIPATWNLSMDRDSLDVKDVLKEFNYKGFILKEYNNGLHLCKPEFNLEKHLSE